MLLRSKNTIGEPLPSLSVELNDDLSIQFVITTAILETSLLMRYGNEIPITSVWEDDYDVNVVLISNKSDLAEFEDLNDELIAIGGGLANVPLRQVAQIKPTWNEGSIYRRNGIKTITISADVKRDYNAMSITQKVQDAISDITLSDGVTLSYGGEYEENNEQMPNMIAALLIAIIIILFILVFHFKKVGTAILIVACLALCVFGAGAGVLIQGVDFSVTSVMGIVSLMGILVRNGIIMFDYAEELRKDEKMIARVAIYNSAKRRMRPIFLTSMAASMGVIPMILGKSGLWMPMGTVIFYGTLITMIFVLTVMPVAYSVVMSGTTKKRAHWNKMEKE